ncbi:MAG: hypothetical protein ACP5VE_11065 [Chthonomonadales bacterium]
MKSRFVIGIMFVALNGFVPKVSAQTQLEVAAKLTHWLTHSLAEQHADVEHGRFSWAVGIFTGNMYKDPLRAEAMRWVFSVWLNRVAAEGDRVVVAGFEQDVGKRSHVIELKHGADSLQEVFDALPSSPMPGSVGGKNIERAMAGLADKLRNDPERRRVILLLSNGPSQTVESTVDWTSRLVSAGYGHPVHTIFQIPIHSTRQEVHVFLAVQQNGVSSVHNGARLPAAPNGVWVPEGYAPEAATASLSASGLPGRVPPKRHGSWLGIILGMAVVVIAVLAGALFALEMKGRGLKSRLPNAGAPTTSSEDGHNSVARLEAALERLEGGIRKLEAGPASGGSAAIPAVPNQEMSELRTKAEALRLKLQDWDDTAMQYLDAVQRALSMQGITDERRNAWMKAGANFARFAAQNGFDVIAPNPGEPFIQGHHKAVNGMPGTGACVVRCIHWGYRRENHVYRPAEVEAAPPPERGEV